MQQLLLRSSRPLTNYHRTHPHIACCLYLHEAFALVLLMSTLLSSARQLPSWALLLPLLALSFALYDASLRWDVQSEGICAIDARSRSPSLLLALQNADSMDLGVVSVLSTYLSFAAFVFLLFLGPASAASHSHCIRVEVACREGSIDCCRCTTSSPPLPPQRSSLHWVSFSKMLCTQAAAALRLWCPSGYCCV